MPLLIGNLEFHIERAKDLPNTDYEGWTGSDLTDPFVVGSIGNTKLFNTTTKDNSLNPVWDERFLVPVNTIEKFIKIQIQDEEVLIPSEEVGTVFIPCDKLVRGDEMKGWFDLDFHGRNRGQIKMLIKFYPNECGIANI